MSVTYEQLFPPLSGVETNAAIETESSRGIPPQQQLYEYDSKKRITKITQIYSDGTQEVWDFTWDETTGDVLTCVRS